MAPGMSDAGTATPYHLIEDASTRTSLRVYSALTTALRMTSTPGTLVTLATLMITSMNSARAPGGGTTTARTGGSAASLFINPSVPPLGSTTPSIDGRRLIV